MSSPPPESSYASPHLTVLLVAILVALFLLTSFFICLCKCFMENLFANWPLHNGPMTVNVVVVGPGPGLNASAIQSFPTFKYVSVKELREEKYGLECAICLLEFEAESVLRLLTLCYHVFHRECIDLWLESHKTCPVCRRDLTIPPEKTLEIRSPVPAGDRDRSPMPSIRESSNESSEGSISIDIREGEDERRTGSADRATNPRGWERVEWLPRSHSTGHSIARNDCAGVDRYTLRFPDHVKVQIGRGHTGSCITFWEISECNKRRRCGGFGEVSGSSR